MRVDFIIDGYNLMHAAGLARENYAPGGLERSRNRLLSVIRHGLTQEQRSHTTVVFDGQGTQGGFSPEFQFHGILVTFSSSGQEADDLIEEFIAAHSFPKNLFVVSGDHRLHKAARTRKAQAIDSTEFFEQLVRSRKERLGQTGSESVAEPEKPVSGNTEDWLEEFGDIDLQEIEKGVVKEIQQEKKIKKEIADQKHPPATKATKPSEQSDFSPQTDQGQPEQNRPFDLEFWENRIAELDQEGY
ncbi:NYN domain-containing protein [Thalassoglobus sp.]|uniref:NYN domain-containing protein n=1 Tax=Thalassoglobus sp. TaxID=2795869 RepID=UPI003AA7D04D